ncbi:MAG: hypothetical protein A2735_01665 [Candidatus Yanofskybacteria bacterium RIFCSPHIGHO2_01_FULL_41_21]|uniref:Uncharacterized protein n=1 Tax=Candidatus Yanofskybacteria bacterium RIFCSPHIGHO2_01_FULL_41_21 TaxID=1802660 RepID=A0A1F8E9T5_9BACT|nr:MAG: hypothetical protein A2735_01665 [Candidatus Yanofskybacteria bacterium RIFCSPHIGHO2_01_FULL_41_21]
MSQSASVHSVVTTIRVVVDLLNDSVLSPDADTRPRVGGRRRTDPDDLHRVCVVVRVAVSVKVIPLHVVGGPALGDVSDAVPIQLGVTSAILVGQPIVRPFHHQAVVGIVRRHAPVLAVQLPVGAVVSAVEDPGLIVVTELIVADGQHLAGARRDHTILDLEAVLSRHGRRREKGHTDQNQQREDSLHDRFLLKKSFGIA